MALVSQRIVGTPSQIRKILQGSKSLFVFGIEFVCLRFFSSSLRYFAFAKKF